MCIVNFCDHRIHFMHYDIGLSLLLVDPSEHLLVRRLCDTLSRGSADTLPVFPVDMEMMTRVRERVNITRKLDKLLLDNRSVLS